MVEAVLRVREDMVRVEGGENYMGWRRKARTLRGGTKRGTEAEVNLKHQRKIPELSLIHI